MTHLQALELNLSNERIRLNNAKNGSREQTLRKVWVTQLEKEIAGERDFQGLDGNTDISDDDLLEQLFEVSNK